MYMNAYELAGREWTILYLVNGLKVEEVKDWRDNCMGDQNRR